MTFEFFFFQCIALKKQVYFIQIVWFQQVKKSGTVQTEHQKVACENARASGEAARGRVVSRRIFFPAFTQVPYFSIFTFFSVCFSLLSYSFTSDTVRKPVHTGTKGSRKLSDNPIRDDLRSKSARRSLAPLQKSRRNPRLMCEQKSFPVCISCQLRSYPVMYSVNID